MEDTKNTKILESKVPMVQTIKENARRFFKKFFWRFLSRVLEILILGLVGHYALGLNLVRY